MKLPPRRPFAREPVGPPPKMLKDHRARLDDARRRALASPANRRVMAELAKR
jgi:hypothetical protein